MQRMGKYSGGQGCRGGKGVRRGTCRLKGKWT